MSLFANYEKILSLPAGRRLALNSRPAQGALLLLLLIISFICLYSLGREAEDGLGGPAHYKPTFSTLSGKVFTPQPKLARRLDAEELLQRPQATDLTSIPKLFHQSWMNATLPTKFEEWSMSCRRANPDWEWVLWTDEDNLKLVEKYAPWFMDTYDDLHSEIYRADASRNIYMHVFGGVYADLDTECVLPYDGLFATYNTSTVVHNAPSPSSKPSDKSGIIEKGQSESAFHLKPSKQSKPLGLEIPVSKFGERKAFLGRMGTDDNFEHSIPNAWMGSTPGHPFWVLPLESCAANVGNGARPEMITGPVALYDQVRVYRDEYGQGQGDGRTKMDDHYAKSGWRHLYKQFSGDSSKAVAQSMVVLPFWEVYAYSWHRDGEAFRKLCWVTQATFNAALCKLVLGLEHWGSHSITYWSHSWNEDGHWDDHMDALNSPNKNPGKSGGKYGSEQIGVEEGKRAERKSKKGTVNNQQIGAP